MRSDVGRVGVHRRLSPWCVGDCLSPQVLLSLRMPIPGVSLSQSPLLIRTSVNGLLPVFVFVQISPSTDTRTHPMISSHFHHLLRDYLQIQSRSEVLGVRTSAYEFGGHSSAHDTIYTLALLWTTSWCCKPGCRDDPHPKLVASTDWSSVRRPWSGIAELFGLLID